MDVYEDLDTRNELRRGVLSSLCCPDQGNLNNVPKGKASLDSVETDDEYVQ